MRTPVERSNLRRRAELIYREYRALCIQGNRLSGRERIKIDRSLQVLPSLPRKKLQEMYSKVRGELQKMRDFIGAKASLSVYEHILDQHKPSTILWIPKLFILEFLFDRYENAWPMVARLPPHARIGVDTQGILALPQQEMSWTLLEAKLHEDMAILWNTTLNAQAEKERKNTKLTVKTVDALVRATVRSAFHLVEGYINALAWDTIYTHGNNLNKEKEGMLKEWNFQTGKRRLLGLREKLITYRRIAARKSHPLLQENNCPELKLILERESDWRHALVHPKVDVDDEETMREAVFFNLSLANAAEIIDSALGLIEKISASVGLVFGDTSRWLYKRAKDGRFPMETFQ